MASPATGAERHNVLFILVDDLKPAIGCFGDAMAKSPHLDQLAARGVAFQHAYVQQALCSPSRSSLMTGRRPDTTKVWDLTTHFRTALPDVRTLPQLFKENGYITQSLGKIYHSVDFEDPASWTIPNTFKPAPRFDPDGLAIIAKEKAGLAAQGKHDLVKWVRGEPWGSPEIPDDALTDGSLAAKAIETIGELSAKEEPFFLAIGFMNPHLPFVAPEKYWDLYDPATIKLPDNYRSRPGDPPRSAKGWSELRHYSGMPKSGPVTDEDAINLIHGYYAAVSYVDAQVGRLMAALDEKGLRENTLVVLLGDHGFHLGDHGLWCKHTNFESAVRAPLIISAPGIKAPGSNVERLVEFVDIYPTVAELGGVALPDGLEGTSLVPLMNAPSRPWKLAAFSQYPRWRGGMGYSMRTERYRYTVWRDETNAVLSRELYDHASDPAEDLNLATLPDNAELLASLDAQLEEGWVAAARQIQR